METETYLDLTDELEKLVGPTSMWWYLAEGEVEVLALESLCGGNFP